MSKNDKADRRAAERLNRDAAKAADRGAHVLAAWLRAAAKR